MSFVATIEGLCDAEGAPSGELITLSPHLLILVPPEPVTVPPDACGLGRVCGKCDRELMSWQSQVILGLSPGDRYNYIACDCLVVAFGPPLTIEAITSKWKSFRRLKAEILGRNEKGNN